MSIETRAQFHGTSGQLTFFVLVVPIRIPDHVCVCVCLQRDEAEQDSAASGSVDETKVGAGTETWGRKIPVHLLATTYNYVHHNPGGDPAMPLRAGFWALATEVSNSVTGIHLHHLFIKGATVRCDREALQGWLAAIQKEVRTGEAHVHVVHWVCRRGHCTVCS